MQVHLVHWNDAEAAQRLAQLREAGYFALRSRAEPAVLRERTDDPPDAIDATWSGLRFSRRV